MSVAWKGLHTAPAALSEKIPTRVCSVVDDPYFDEHPSDTEESDTSVILYEDKFVRLSQHFLSLKCYYFPSGKEKRVAIDVITSISQKNDDFTAWGTLDGKIWWNYDFLRGRRSHMDCYFVIECQEKLAKGITCRKPYSFWKQLSSLRPDLTRNQTPPRRRLSQASSLDIPTSPRISESSLLIDYAEES